MFDKKTLIELANKDFQELTCFILTMLLTTPHIQKAVIVKALIGEIYSKNAERRHACLAALNRMHEIIADDDSLQRIRDLFADNKIDKIFVASILRTCGFEGEQILLKELKYSKDFTVRVASASVLFYRLNKEVNRLQVILDNNDYESNAKYAPGTFCKYLGKISPLVFEEEYETDVLEINSRDFLAALQRMLNVPLDHSNPQICFQENFLTIDQFDISSATKEPLRKRFEFFGTNSQKETEETNPFGRFKINPNVIKGLVKALSDTNSAVKDTAAASIGRIGMPEASLAINGLVKLSKDAEVNIRAKAICAIGRIADGCSTAVIEHIFSSVDCNMWKVKSAALYALSCFGERASKYIPNLLKLLKDTSVNKQTVAETIIKIGFEGEKTLINLLKNTEDNNYKLKGSIVKAISLIDIGSANLDFALEIVFNSAESRNDLIRKCSLFTLNNLALKGKDFCQYLKTKSLIPVFYKALSDENPEIQSVYS